MTALVVTVVVGLGTYLSRSGFVIALADRQMPPLVERALRNVGPAVLSALVATLLVGDEGVSALGPSPETVALVVAGVVAWRTKNMAWSLAGGMAAFWLLLAVWG